MESNEPTSSEEAGASPDRPIDRLAARALVFDADGRVLLVHHRDPQRPEAGVWWIAPGGGRHEGEEPRSCAARELHEETGLHLDPSEFGAAVLDRTVTFPYNGRWMRQSESFFPARIADRQPQVAPVSLDESEGEHLAVFGLRWWSAAELRDAEAGGESFFPIGLSALIAEVLRAADDVEHRPQ